MIQDEIRLVFEFSQSQRQAYVREKYTSPKDAVQSYDGMIKKCDEDIAFFDSETKKERVEADLEPGTSAVIILERNRRCREKIGELYLKKGELKNERLQLLAAADDPKQPYDRESKIPIDVRGRTWAVLAAGVDYLVKKDVLPARSKDKEAAMYFIKDGEQIKDQYISKYREKGYGRTLTESDLKFFDWAGEIIEKHRTSSISHKSHTTR